MGMIKLKYKGTEPGKANMQQYNETHSYEEIIIVKAHGSNNVASMCLIHKL